MYVEGQTRIDNPDFITKDEFQDDIDDANLYDNVSAGDFEEELNDKNDLIERKVQPRLDFFDKIEYFDRLFPSKKIQKPGYDLYGTTTAVLGLIGLFVFFCYGFLSVDQSKFLQNQKNNNNIFKGDMACCLLIVIVVIIIERYVNRTDTKAVK